MVDDEDFVVKVYQRKSGRKNVQKWYMHYCDQCKDKRGYAPKSKSGLCISCACKGRIISPKQKQDISATLKGNKNAANVSKEVVIARTAKRMGMTVEEYLAQKPMQMALQKIRKNMCDRLIRFLRDERRSVKYFSFKRSELIKHLQALFMNHPETGEPMTWLNYGRISGINCWEIDHKIPLRYKENGSFYWNQKELQDPNSDTFKKAWSLDNLQPLWAKMNWSKGSHFKD